MFFGEYEDIVEESGKGDDTDSTGEEEGAWSSKGKGKGKAKSETQGETAGEASGSVPRSTSKAVLLTAQTIAELEANLPQFSAEAYGIEYEMDDEVVAELEELKSSERPSLSRYVELELHWASVQEESTREEYSDQSPARLELNKRGRALRSLFEAYKKAHGTWQGKSGASLGPDGVGEWLELNSWESAEELG